jgi:hypothetical protein
VVQDVRQGAAVGPHQDLLGRMIAWRIQEKFYGGHDKATIKLLDGLISGEAEKLEAAFLRVSDPDIRPPRSSTRA